MKVPRVVFKLNQELDKAGIDYRIGGGQAAVFYGIREDAEDWDLAVEEITPELKEVMEALDFTEIPDSEGKSWEGPALIDFIIADGEKYPTLDELGLHYVEGLKFVSRSMMGYINWKEGNSAYQHLKDYKEKIEMSGLPKPVKEITDLKRFREASFSYIEAAPYEFGLDATYKNVVHITTSPTLEDMRTGVVDFRYDTEGIANYLRNILSITTNFKVVVADVHVENEIRMTGDVQRRYGFTKPFDTIRVKDVLVDKGIDALLWSQYRILQVLDLAALDNVRVYDSSDFQQVIDEVQEEQDRFVFPVEDGTERTGSKQMSSLQKYEKEAPTKTIKKAKSQLPNEIPGGLADHWTAQDIARKHNVSEDWILHQLEIGIDIEKEHTSNLSKAKEIALDHLHENPKYYYNPHGTDLVNMEEEAEERMEQTGNFFKKIIQLAEKAEENGCVLQATQLDRLVQEAQFTPTQEPNYTEMASSARTEHVINEIMWKITGVQPATINYYRALESALKNLKQLLEQAEQLDKGSQKYIEIVRYVQDTFNTKYDPYNTDHVPTKIAYILELLRIEDIVRKNLSRFLTPDVGVSTAIEHMIQLLKDQELLKEFNRLKKVLE